MKLRSILALVMTVVLTTTVFVYADTEEWCDGIDFELEASPDNYTVVEGMLDPEIYGENAIYVQEHADWVEAYNEALLNSQVMPLDDGDTGVVAPVIGQFTQWDWSNGMFISNPQQAALFRTLCYFDPVNPRLYTDTEVYEVNEAPSIIMIKLNSNGTLTYDSTKVLEAMEGRENCYQLKDELWPANLTDHYVFVLHASSNWSVGNFKVNFTTIKDIVSTDVQMEN